jgi:hypothetical protein
MAKIRVVVVDDSALIRSRRARSSATSTRT